MGRLFPFLVCSQISNLIPLAGYLLYSNTTKFAGYLFCLLLGQLLWPLLTLRLDIQLQVELYRSRQDYVLALALWVLFGFTVLGSTALLGIRGMPIEQSVLDPGWGGLLLGIALALSNVVRAYFVAVGNDRLLIGLETANTFKNVLAFGIFAWVAEAGILRDLKLVFVWVNVAFGALVIFCVLVWLRHWPAPRILSHFLRVGSSQIPIMWRRARRVFLFSFPNSFIGMLTGRLPLLAIEQMLAVPLAAAFLAANRLTLSPLNFLIFAFRISSVIELNKRRKGLVNHFRKFFWVITGLAPILLSPMLLPVFDSDIFDFILKYFDTSWKAAVAFLPMTFPWAVLFFITGWMDRYFDIVGLQHIVLIIEITMAGIACAISWLIFAGILGGVTALWSIIAFGCVHALAWLTLFILKEIKHAG